MAYLDNIIIYLNSVEEYKEHIKWVLKKLHKKNILIVIKKYKFYTRKTDFIGFIIKLKQISMDLKKIKAIVNW
jgi:ribosome-interacting GTPase 1